MQRYRRSTSALAFGTILILSCGVGAAQGPIGNDQYAFKTYAVNSAFYPIVQVYLRTWDQNQQPLINVNYMNIGLMVKGRNYDPAKIDAVTRSPQYVIETLQNRDEGFRTVIVLDCSASMTGKPFADAQNALMKFIEAKRANDQVAVIAVRDTVEGYQLVSGFEKNPVMLYQRIGELKPDGKKSRIYDTIAAALQLCATASQGGSSNATGESAVLSTVVVLSDGKDEGSAVARDELMNRIGQLPIPIPINSLAYSAGDTSAFANLEALSKGSFGRFWTHTDSQAFASTMQEIHRINRMDYVVTFRSYVPIDGESHPVRVGISYPTNTGRYVWDGGEFEAVDSPAKYVPEARAMFDQLMAAIPALHDQCPYMDCTPVGTSLSPVIETGGSESSQSTDSADSDAGGTATASEDESSPEADQSESLSKVIENNAALFAVGLGVAVLAVALVLWVRRSVTPVPVHDPSTHGVRQTARRTSQPGIGGGPPTDPDPMRSPTEPISKP